MATHGAAAATTVRLLIAVLGLSVILASDAVAAAKKPKPPATVDSTTPCRGGNLFQCGPVTNGNDYLGTDPDPFIRLMIQRDLGAKYGGSP